MSRHQHRTARFFRPGADFFQLESVLPTNSLLGLFSDESIDTCESELIAGTGSQPDDETQAEFGWSNSETSRVSISDGMSTTGANADAQEETAERGNRQDTPRTDESDPLAELDGVTMNPLDAWVGAGSTNRSSWKPWGNLESWAPRMVSPYATPDGGFFDRASSETTVVPGPLFVTTSQQPMVEVATDEVDPPDPPDNNAPVAVADQASTAEETPIDIAVTANDTDSDGDPIFIQSWTVVTGHGWVKQTEDGKLRYTPDQDFVGQDTFTYTIKDGWDEEASAQVTVTVTPVNDAPVAFNDGHTYYGMVYGEDPVTFNVNWVVANDRDYDGNPLTTSSSGTASTGTLSLDNGNLFLTVPSGTYGMVSFTYKVSDAIVESNWATGNLFIIAPNTPWPGPFTASSDDYALGEDAMQSSPSVVANDTGAVLAVLLSHPVTGRMNSFDSDGVFGYTPDYRTTDESFFYKIFNSVGASLTASVNLYGLRLQIYNGQGAISPVEDKVRQTVGAFTVANRNDTDGDGMVDRDDSNVNPNQSEPSGVGIEEVDLMKLVIRKPNDPNPGQNMITLQVIGPAELWQSPNKVSLAPLTYAPADIPAGGLTVWVEATDTSAELRDITIRMNYRGEKFTVVATGIWADMTNFRNTGDSLSADDDGFWTHWGLASETAPAGVNRFGATRVLNRPANGMEVEFTLYPSGLGLEPGLRFDVTRDKEKINFVTVGPLRAPFGQQSFPLFLDIPNDDTTARDEDNDPRAYLGPLPPLPPASYVVHNTDHVYAIDFPGIDSPAAGNAARLEIRWNFYEFLRVRLDGDRFLHSEDLLVHDSWFQGLPPDRQGALLAIANGIQGSRSSDFEEWRSRMDLISVAGNFQRNNTPGENEIVTGHKPLGN